MLTEIPLLHYFKCKNQYVGAHQGMRYLISPTKLKKVLEDGTEKEEPIFQVDIWPEPWSLERTNPALRHQEYFSLTEEGRKEMIHRLSVLYYSEEERWKNCPDMVDSEPWGMES